MGIAEHRPPEPLDYSATSEPTIFLAGPIQGAPNWQAEAAVTITSAHDSSGRALHICSPRVTGRSTHSYEEQVAWEKAGLRNARDYGVVLFWFAARDDSLP